MHASYSDKLGNGYAIGSTSHPARQIKVDGLPRATSRVLHKSSSFRACARNRRERESEGKRDRASVGKAFRVTLAVTKVDSLLRASSFAGQTSVHAKISLNLIL